MIERNNITVDKHNTGFKTIPRTFLGCPYTLYRVKWIYEINHDSVIIYVHT